MTAPPREANLCAVVASASEPAKLKVGPCFLPSIFYGDYWVVRASQFGRTGSEPDARTDTYDWAIVSGGQPTIPGTDGCRTGTDVNQSGAWLQRLPGSARASPASSSPARPTHRALDLLPGPHHPRGRAGSHP